jgi:hypothetical protein
MKTTLHLIDNPKKLLKALDKTAGGRSSGPMGELVYRVPRRVAMAAELGLGLRIYNEEVRGLKQPGGTDIGVARAVQLMTKERVGVRTLKRMKAYFSRHQRDKKHKDWGNEDRPSPGYVAWLLWGGDEGWRWAEKELSR